MATAALLLAPAVLVATAPGVSPGLADLLGFAFAVAVALRIAALLMFEVVSDPLPRRRESEAKVALHEPLKPAPGKLDESKPLTYLQTLLRNDRPFDAVNELDRLQSLDLADTEDPSTRACVDEIRLEILKLTTSLEAGEEVWTKSFKHRGVQIYTSKLNKRDFKVVDVARDTGLFDLVSLIYETDLYHKWVPGCVQASRTRPSIFRQFAYMRFTVPIPMVKDRHILIKGYGDVFQGKSVMIYIQSVEASPELEATLNVQPGSVACTLEHAGMLFTPSGPDTEIQLMSRIDLGLAIVPDSVFDHAAKYILAEMIHFLKLKASKACVSSQKHEPWRRRQIEDSAVYDEARVRLNAMTI